jgi:hypothetical protein
MTVLTKKEDPWKGLCDQLLQMTKIFQSGCPKNAAVEELYLSMKSNSSSFFTLEDGTDRLFRNARKELPLLAT